MAAGSELLQPLGILVLDADDDRQLGVGIADMGLGSTVSSMTSVRARPPSVRPMSSRRLPGDVVLCGLRTTI
ncbi:MAG TPA: hypothetical protein VG147_00035 [Solirubrobacteraceae bacterium]|nr:hypothetical protein [Solirubrobacteraceae bacterium]